MAVKDATLYYQVGSKTADFLAEIQDPANANSPNLKQVKF